MQGLFTYSGIVVKIRAMSGQLVKKEAYEEMAAFNHVPEVINYLKQYPSYAKLLSGDMHSVKRIEAEGLIRMSVFYDFYKIYLFAGVKQRRFLDIYYLRYENAILKRCLRNIFDHRDVEINLADITGFFEKKSALYVDRLRSAKTIDEFVDALKGSLFYPVLKRLGEYKSATLFEYENTLNLFFVKRMFSEYNKVLKNRDLEAIMSIYSSETELLNLQWIYRAKKYYQMTPADIYAFIIPLNYKISKETLKQMVEAPTPEELEGMFKNCYYARYADIALSTSSIEKVYQELIVKIRSIYIRKYPYSVAAIENYLFQKELEIDKLTTLLEGVRYGLEKDEIMGYIT